MTEMIKVTLTGIFPKEDIGLIANYYGVDESSTEQEELDFIINQIQEEIVKYLETPARRSIAQTYSEVIESESDALRQRVNSAITSSSEIINND